MSPLDIIINYHFILMDLSKEQISILDKHPEIKKQIENIVSKYSFEFDTKENQNKVYSEVSDLIKPFIRNEKLNKLC